MAPFFLRPSYAQDSAEPENPPACVQTFGSMIQAFG